MYATENSPATTLAPDRANLELVFTRLVAAPRDLVWMVWTEPKHLAEWWGPDGFRLITETFDFRQGGEWIHTMIGPDGTEYPNHSVFAEIVPQERIVYEHAGSSATTPRISMSKVATFESKGEQTVITLRLVFETIEEYNNAVNVYGAARGGQQALEKLAEYVRKQLPGAAQGEYFLEISRMFNAPRELVFQAWTDPKMLSAWMGPRGFEAYEVESDLRVGGRWRFSMVLNGEPDTGCDPRGVDRLFMHGTYREITPPEKLVFTFQWENRNVDHPDRENTITITFRELEGKTVMDFKQGPFATSEDRDGHNTGWSSAFDKFAEFMARPVGADKGLPAYELNITRTFDAPRELVWRAWTDPEMAKEWSGPRGFHCVAFSTGQKPGDRWEMTMVGKVPRTGEQVSLKQGGTLLEMRPPELLRYTFAWEERGCVGLPASPYKENEITVRLLEQNGKTVMHFRQTPFATEEERNGHNGGWNSSFDCLTDVLTALQPGRVSSPDDLPSEVHLRRVVHATLEEVFAAWTTPEAVSQWWGPHGFTAPVVELDVRSGGAIRIDMEGPDGTIYPMTGRFVEVYPPFRFHFISTPLDAAGNMLMELWNSVYLQQVPEGVEIIVDCHVMRAIPAADQHRKGMVIGWGQMMDRMAAFADSPANKEVLQ